jgi:hypothetical protein
LFRTLRAALITLLVFGTLAGTAHAAGGNYVFDGGTQRQQAEVRAALRASTFDWSVVPTQVTVHITNNISYSRATPGHIYLDGRLLDSGRFAWAVVQDEYAHQVDFALFDDAIRAQLGGALGSSAWCHADVAGLAHSSYGCERFASTLVWSFWQSPHNAYKPESKSDEAAAMAPAKFRALMADVLRVSPKWAAASRR